MKIPQQPATTTVPTQPDESEPHPLVLMLKTQRVKQYDYKSRSTQNRPKAPISAAFEPDCAAYQGNSTPAGRLSDRLELWPGPHLDRGSRADKKSFPGHRMS